MTDKRLTQLMQEVLDETASAEETQELFATLEDETEAAVLFDRLQRVDNLLRTAPHERAPERLAVTILARLARSIEQEAEFQHMPEATRQAVMFSLSLVLLVTLPMMVLASWMVLYAHGDPALLLQVLYQVIALLAMLIEALITLLDRARELAAEDPQAAVVAMALVPVVLLGVLGIIREFSGSDDGDAG